MAAVVALIPERPYDGSLRGPGGYVGLCASASHGVVTDPRRGARSVADDAY
jgi:hypothetical protein